MAQYSIIYLGLQINNNNNNNNNNNKLAHTYGIITPCEHVQG